MNPTTILRTVLTLLLTLAVMGQPMLVYAMADSVTEHVTVSESVVCGGCGCCELNAGETACCCCGNQIATAPRNNPTDENPTDGNPADNAQTDDTVGSSCHCCITVPPLSRDLPRTELLRQLTHRIVTDRIAGDGCGDAIQPTAVADWTDVTGARCDFSQRFLCVWRI